MSEELMACPVCHKDDAVEWEAKPVRDVGGCIYYAGCNRCSLYALKRDKSEAIVAWNDLTARLAAAEAERDAAVSAAAWNHTQAAVNKTERDAAVARAEAAASPDAVSARYASLTAAQSRAMVEDAERVGERRATAAIVEYLRKVRSDPAFYRVCMEVDNLRARIERGDHIKA